MLRLKPGQRHRLCAILAGLNEVADGKLGDDSGAARESWMSTIKQVEVHSPLFFKNLLKGYKEMHGTDK